MAFSYLAYGLRLAADRPIPGFLEISSDHFDVVTHLTGKLPSSADAAETLWYRSRADDDGAEPGLTLSHVSDGAHFRLVYADGPTFIVDRAGREIWASWPRHSTLEDTATYLQGPVLAFVLHLRGITCLHASVVEIGDAAVAFAGPAGSGKSTLAAAFALRGRRVLSDDVAPLLANGDTIRIAPGYPRVCLWPDSVKLLCGSPDALPRWTPNWEKCYLALNESGRPFFPEPLRLRAVCILSERSEEVEAVRVERVAPAEGLIALVTNTYMNYLPDPAARASEFELFGRVADQTWIGRVAWPDGAADIGALCDRIVETVAALPAGEGAQLVPPRD